MVNWKEIHPDFTPKLQKEWEDQNLSYEETRQWINIGLNPQEFELVSYLYDNKHKPSALSDNNLVELRKEFNDNLAKWKNVHPSFNYELQVEWEKKGFNYNECKKWIDVGLKPSDADYAYWLRGIKKVIPKLIGKKTIADETKKEIGWTEFFLSFFGLWQQKEEIELVNVEYQNDEGEASKKEWRVKYKESEYKKWVDIHQDFSSDEGNNFQNRWKGYGFTPQTAKEWIKTGFTPKDCESVVNIVNYARWKGYQPQQVSKRGLTEEYNIAQNYLGFHYPKKKRKQVKELNISYRDLTGELDLGDFENLEKLYCSDNLLTSLNLVGCDKLIILKCKKNQLANLNLDQNSKLKELDGSDNKIIDCNFLNSLSIPEKLTMLNLSDNNITQDLSIFSRFINLERLELNNNSFFGSLEHLAKLGKLEKLNISDTDINSGVEYLPDSLNSINKNAKIVYYVHIRPESKVNELKWQLDLLINDINKQLQKEWIKFGFVYKEIWEWIRSGLRFEEYEFADYLKKERNFSSWEIEKNLDELKKDWIWKKIHSDFISELRKKWEEKGFDCKTCKEWLDVGLKPDEVNYCTWLRDVKKVNTKWVLKCRKSFEKAEIDPKLSVEIVGKIKKFKHSYNAMDNKLTSEQESVIDKLILDEELKSRYVSYGLCRGCDQPMKQDLNSRYGLCLPCNYRYLRHDFRQWTSKPVIDAFIKNHQSKAKEEAFKWIPYKQFKDTEYIAKGGFGIVYKAEWVKNQGINKSKKRRESKLVALKSLNNFCDVTTDFLQEIANHKLLGSGQIVKCYGISQDPQTKNYVMVMEYIKDGDLRQYLSNSHLSFESKLHQLKTIASGLNSIHGQELIHRDLHSGNVLSNYSRCWITDLGLCRPAGEEGKEKIYGVLPYIAPEVLLKRPYTQVADIYSFGIIAYELFSSKLPYYEFPHDEDLAIKICQGLRPNLNEIRMPQLLKDLINWCWDADPKKRPTASELENFLCGWLKEISTANELSLDNLNEDYRLEIYYKNVIPNNAKFYRQYREIEKKYVKKFNGSQFFTSSSNKLFLETHPRAIYTSRPLDFKNLPEPQNSKEINEQFWKQKDKLHGTKDLELDINDIDLDKLSVQEQSSTQAQIQIPTK